MTIATSDYIRRSNNKKLFYLLLFIWFLVNLAQAIFMEIMSDEAYYGLFASNLDWGYYDHPPMVALMIKVSSFLFSGNLGIRFMTVILQLGTLILIWKTVDSKLQDSNKPLTFFIIAASITMFSAYGVITSPDAPLLFFTALFFYSYKRFLADMKWSATLLLTVSMAGLVYSKYQAVLVIGFVILSNLRLLGKIRFWIAGVLALMLLTPHIYWQISNDFPSFQYHLVDRSAGFKLKYFIEYLPNQLAVFNPLTLGAIIYIFIKYRPSGDFTKILYFQIIGFIGFFWLTSFRGHVEPHWTIACSIPMIILLTEKSAENKSLSRYVHKFIFPTLFLILGLRLLVMTDFDFIKSTGFSGKKEKYENIESVAKELPVIFTGSFQNPSLYQFFTGSKATVMSSVYSRQTQFDLWQFEREYQNKPAFVSIKAEGKSQVYGIGKLQFSGFKTDSLQTVNRMKIRYSIADGIFHQGDSIRIALLLQNTYDCDIDFNHHQFPVGVCIVFIKGKDITVQDVFLSEQVGIISAGETLKRDIEAVIPELKDGDYSVGICLRTLFGPSLNSTFTKISLINHD